MTTPSRFVAAVEARQGGFSTLQLPGGIRYQGDGIEDLLLHFDGPNDSSSFIDSGKNNLTVVRSGEAKISTGQSKFGGAAGFFRGRDFAPPDDRLTIDSETLTLGNSDFTIDVWVYKIFTGNKYANYGIIGFDAGLNAFEVLSYDWSFDDTQPPSAIVLRSSGGEIKITLPFLANQWVHIALVRKSGTIRMAVNGKFSTSTISSSNTAWGAGKWFIGDRSLQPGFENEGLGRWPFEGYIDELRVRIGAALYEGNFVPPNQPFL
jgi:hypothetical protein